MFYGLIHFYRYPGQAILLEKFGITGSTTPSHTDSGAMLKLHDVSGRMLPHLATPQNISKKYSLCLSGFFAQAISVF